jgi:hypothetical protein
MPDLMKYENGGSLVVDSYTFVGQTALSGALFQNVTSSAGFLGATNVISSSLKLGSIPSGYGVFRTGPGQYAEVFADLWQPGSVYYAHHNIFLTPGGNLSNGTVNPVNVASASNYNFVAGYTIKEFGQQVTSSSPFSTNGSPNGPVTIVTYGILSASVFGSNPVFADPTSDVTVQTTIFCENASGPVTGYPIVNSTTTNLVP